MTLAAPHLLPINGVVILDKPLGLSSQQAVTRVKRCFSANKAGHTGSLDLEASGLLPVCLGEATKFSHFLLDADKRYQVTAKLGITTDTFDAAGNITAQKSWRAVNKELIQQALQQLTGKIQQLPPMYSALKHHGKPLYELARKGIAITRQTREITIYQFELLNWQADELQLFVHCSKGTYIRSLVDDLGKLLNCGAHVTNLRRLTAGHFTAEQMVSLEELQNLAKTNNLLGLTRYVLPPESLLGNLPSILLLQEQVERLWQGKEVLDETLSQIGLVQLISEKMGFIGVGEVTEPSRLRSKRLLNPQLLHKKAL